MRIKLLFFLLPGLFMLLASCSMISKRGVKLNYEIIFEAAETINSCKGNDSNPVQIKIYQLRNQDNFIKADLKTAWQPVKPLADDIVNDDGQSTIYPARLDTVKHAKLGETQFLGIVADFCKPDLEGWSLVVPLKKRISRKRFSFASKAKRWRGRKRENGNTKNLKRKTYNVKSKEITN